MFDLTPLINQLKEYNLNQALILQELQSIKKILESNAPSTKK